MRSTGAILPGGRVRVGKDEFDSVSAAAVAAIKQATEADRSINGWDFWQVPTAEGTRVPLNGIRAGGAILPSSLESNLVLVGQRGQVARKESGN